MIDRRRTQIIYFVSLCYMLFFVAFISASIEFRNSNLLFPVLLLLAGFFVMGFTTTLQRLIPTISPDMEYSQHILLQIIDETTKEETDELSEKPENYVLSARIVEAAVDGIKGEYREVDFDLDDRSSFSPIGLIGFDNAVALASIRISIERELRQLSDHVNGSDTKRMVSITRLAEQLASENIIPASFIPPLDRVLHIANAGIHGEDISDAITRTIVESALSLINALHSIRIDLERP